MTGRPWTVIAYIVADDARTPILNDFAREEMKAMEDAAAASDINLAIYVDFTDEGPQSDSLNCFVGGSSGSAKDACSITPEANAASVGTLRKFLAAAQANGPQNSRYALVFWGHGAGPAGFFLDPTPDPPSSLSLPQIWQALQVLPMPIEVMILKDCWTANLEMAVEFDDAVRFVIGAQGLVPIPGVWPYTDLFNILKQMPDPGTRNDFKGLLKPLDLHYRDENNRGRPPHDHVIFSALDVEGSRGAIRVPLTKFVDALKGLKGSDRWRSRNIMDQATGGDTDLVDVITMCDGLAAFPDPMGQAAKDLRAVVLNQLYIGQTEGTPGIAPDTSLKGVSIFRRSGGLQTNSKFIESVFYDNYNALTLCGTTQWNDIAWETILDPNL